MKTVIDKKKFEEFCRRNHIRRLWLFGSVLTDDFREDSDVDVLYEFEPDQTIGFRIFRIEEELSALFSGRKVDLAPAEFLNKHIRNHPDFRAELVFEDVK